jgi:hypothetical protein
LEQWCGLYGIISAKVVIRVSLKSFIGLRYKPKVFQIPQFDFFYALKLEKILMRLYDMTKDAVTGAYSYVAKKVTSAKAVATTAVIGAVVSAEVYATGPCSNTAVDGICTLMTKNNIFTEMKDISVWIALGFIVFGFILFAGFKIYSTTKKS